MGSRPVLAALVAGTLCALVACGDTPPPAAAPSPAVPSAAPSSAASTAGPDLFPSQSPQFGALSTILTWCMPGLPGSPREGCHAGRIRDGLTELTTALRRDIAGRPDPGRYADVSAAVSALERTTAGLRRCDDYFDGGADQHECFRAWDAVRADFDRLAAAANWG